MIKPTSQHERLCMMAYGFYAQLVGVMMATEDENDAVNLLHAVSHACWESSVEAVRASVSPELSRRLGWGLRSLDDPRRIRPSPLSDERDTFALRLLQACWVLHVSALEVSSPSSAAHALQDSMPLDPWLYLAGMLESPPWETLAPFSCRTSAGL